MCAGAQPTTLVQIHSLAYQEKVIREALRFSQAGSFTLRVPDEDFDVGQFTTPPNAIIVLPLGLALMNADIWENPEVLEQFLCNARTLTCILSHSLELARCSYHSHTTLRRHLIPSGSAKRTFPQP